MTYRIIEVDRLTGNERDLTNYSTEPWTEGFTKEQAEAQVAERERTITARYGYRIEEIEQ